MESEQQPEIGAEELQELLDQLDRGRATWINGELGFRLEQDPAFGGDAGSGPRLPDRQRATAQLFHGGTGQSELVKTIASGNLVVVVLVERNEVRVDDEERPQPWVLRTTQVFERREGRWVRLHRHADPLIERRSPTDTFALARGE